MFANSRTALGKRVAISCLAIILGACSLSQEKQGIVRSSAIPPSDTCPELPAGSRCELQSEESTQPAKGAEIDLDDLVRIPQRIEQLPAVASGSIAIPEPCQKRLRNQFQRQFFRPWTAKTTLFDIRESKDFMRKEARASWNGVNKRRVPQQFLQQLLDNCALDSFPSRDDTAIAVAPGHLRGLPTQQPLYQTWEDAPFDMLAFPQLKLNEPLRVLHTSRDGAWYFVESASSSGWVEVRDVALVDRSFIDCWMEGPQVVVVRDAAPIPDGRGISTFQVKLGTILPLVEKGEECWTVNVASVGEGGRAQIRPVQIARESVADFPLRFDSRNVVRIGDQLLGQPYGWGELYDLRDCSALLRDFFMPFGIWLPRTSGDQIASTGRPERFNHTPAQAKEELIRSKAIPFLTLLYKPGHIMLYVGTDKDGQPLVLHASWSVRIKDGGEARTQITGVSAITTLKLGKELGLAPGWSLLEKVTEMGTITGRCK